MLTQTYVRCIMTIRTTRLGVLYLNLFSENIEQFIGQTVIAEIQHVIYGKQKVTLRSFQPFCTEDKIGFFMGENAIYLHRDKIENVRAHENVCEMNDNLLSIVITKVG